MMKEKDQAFGFLTTLVEEHRKSSNFFKALPYFHNYERVYNLINAIDEEIAEDLQVISCFDFDSKDEYENSFRSITVIKTKKLETFLKNKKSKYKLSLVNSKDSITINFN